MKKYWRIIISIIAVFILVAAYFLFRYPGLFARRTGRITKVMEWIRNPGMHDDWMIEAGDHCDDAVFIFPTTGYVGFLWDDSFRPGHRHAGIDIFSPAEEAGVTPVVAAHDGYLTRLPEWKSTVIIRIPSDPLQPGRQIWNYYTHMADKEGNSFVSDDFPPGTEEVYVEAGTLLGYQGDYSGDPGNPTGLHLHFSVVKDDGNGNFLNELQIQNTLDPSPYFKLNLNSHLNEDEIPLCR